MRNLKEIPTPHPASDSELQRSVEADRLVAELETNGIVVLPALLDPEQLRGMQAAFAARLGRMRWNNFDGYQKTEPYRHMIEDVLHLDQGFVDLALHPLVKQILTRYLGTQYELTEAKGWKTLPTNRDFHGWHGDSWYDKTTEREIHREIKVGMYLTDVRSGAFNFIKGSHQQQHPRDLKRSEVKNLNSSQRIEVAGAAGTIFMFDSSAIHRQGSPVLEPRQAVFYAYHDPFVPLQSEDINYYRYHPLLLNAAFLGNLAPEDQRILGFGNKTNFQPAFERPDDSPGLHRAVCAAFTARLRIKQFSQRNLGRLKRLLHLG